MMKTCEISEINEINNRILAIWEKYIEPGTEYAPLFFKSLQKEGILTIGMNPSFSPEEISKFTGKTIEEIKNIFLWKGKENTRLDEILEIDELSKEEYGRFFDKFKEIENKLNLPHQHIDLFFYRKTNQSDFLKEINKNNNLTDFAKEQLSIVRNLISIINPKIILIANSGAKNIFKRTEIFQLNIKEDFKRIGTSRYKGTPIFFSRMLPGQSAGSLNNDEFERLKWHMCFVNKKL